MIGLYSTRLFWWEVARTELKLSAHANNSSSRPRVSRNEHLECHPDSCSVSLFYASFSLSALSFEVGFFHQAEISALGSSHASQLVSLLFSVSVWKLQGYADWVGLGWVPTPGPMKHCQEGGVLWLAAQSCNQWRSSSYPKEGRCWQLRGEIVEKTKQLQPSDLTMSKSNQQCSY